MALVGTSLFDAMKQEEERRQRAAIADASLKKYIRDTPLLDNSIKAADRLDLLGKTFNVFDMTMNGIAAIEAIHDALTLTQSMRLVSELPKEAQAVNLVSTSLKAGRMMFVLEALGPLATYISFWIDLAAAWAEAKARVLKDNAMRGLSTGAVLGANDAAPGYVGHNFWQHANGSYPAYRELDVASKNMHNGALVAGYAQGKRLSRNQKGRLFAFLHRGFTPGQQKFYLEANPVTGEASQWQNWSFLTKKGYYSDCGAIFQRELLR